MNKENSIPKEKCDDDPERTEPANEQTTTMDQKVADWLMNETESRKGNDKTKEEGRPSAEQDQDKETEAPIEDTSRNTRTSKERNPATAPKPVLTTNQNIAPATKKQEYPKGTIKEAEEKTAADGNEEAAAETTKEIIYPLHRNRKHTAER